MAENKNKKRSSRTKKIDETVAKGGKLAKDVADVGVVKRTLGGVKNMKDAAVNKARDLKNSAMNRSAKAKEGLRATASQADAKMGKPRITAAQAAEYARVKATKGKAIANEGLRRLSSITNESLGRNMDGTPKSTAPKGSAAATANARVEARGGAASSFDRGPQPKGAPAYDTGDRFDLGKRPPGASEDIMKASAKRYKYDPRPTRVKSTLGKIGPAALVEPAIQYGANVAGEGFGPANEKVVKGAGELVNSAVDMGKDVVDNPYKGLINGLRLPARAVAATADLFPDVPGVITDAAMAGYDSIGQPGNFGENFNTNFDRRNQINQTIRQPFSKGLNAFFDAADAYKRSGDGQGQPAGQPAPNAPPPPPATAGGGGGGGNATATAAAPQQRTLASPSNNLVPAPGTGFFQRTGSGDELLNQYSDSPEYQTGNAFEGASGSGNLVRVGSPDTAAAPAAPTTGLRAANADRTFVTADELAQRDGITLGDNPVDNIKTRPYYAGLARNQNKITQSNFDNQSTTDVNATNASRSTAANNKNDLDYQKFLASRGDKSLENARQLEQDEAAAGVAATDLTNAYYDKYKQGFNWINDETSIDQARGQLNTIFSQARTSSYNRTNANSIAAGNIVANTVTPLMDPGVLDSVYNAISQSEIDLGDAFNMDGQFNFAALLQNKAVTSSKENGGDVAMLNLPGKPPQPLFVIDQIEDPAIREQVYTLLNGNKQRRSLNSGK